MASRFDLNSTQFADLKTCLDDLIKLNQEYIDFKKTNNKKRGKKKKFADFIREITTVSIENSQTEELDEEGPVKTSSKSQKSPLKNPNENICEPQKKILEEESPLEGKGEIDQKKDNFVEDSKQSKREESLEEKCSKPDKWEKYIQDIQELKAKLEQLIINFRKKKGRLTSELESALRSENHEQLLVRDEGLPGNGRSRLQRVRRETRRSSVPGLGSDCGLQLHQEVQPEFQPARNEGKAGRKWVVE